MAKIGRLTQEMYIPDLKLVEWLLFEIMAGNPLKHEWADTADGHTAFLWKKTIWIPILWRFRKARRLFVEQFVQVHIKENTKATRYLSFTRWYTNDWWIPLTKGQLRWKGFHVMTSSCWLCLFKIRERGRLSLSAFLRTEDIGVHIVHISRLIITDTLE